MDCGSGESLICASTRSMVEFEDQERTLPDVVEKESGNPVTLTACLREPS